MLSLTPAVLRALAEGVSRLHKGDLKDGAAADEVLAVMVRDHGLLLSNYAWYPVADAHSGYVKPGVYATKAIEANLWWLTGYETGQELAPGQVLYHDPECTIPLRTL